MVQILATSYQHIRMRSLMFWHGCHTGSSISLAPFLQRQRFSSGAHQEQWMFSLAALDTWTLLVFQSNCFFHAHRHVSRFCFFITIETLLIFITRVPKSARVLPGELFHAWLSRGTCSYWQALRTWYVLIIIHCVSYGLWCHAIPTRWMCYHRSFVFSTSLSSS